MLLDFGHLNYRENEDPYNSEVSKSCSVENEGVDKSSISSKSKNFRARKSILLRGVDPPEILEETHTGMVGY
jgi:hypothetical protein